MLGACTRAPSGDGPQLASSPAPDAAQPAAVDPAAATAAAIDPAPLLSRYLDIAATRVASRDCLHQEQAAWEAQTQARCGADAACLEAAQLARARTLEGLVPGAALDRGLANLPIDDSPQLFYVGGSAQPPDAGAPPSVAVTLEGTPFEDEGGFLLTGEGFDADAHAEFNALLGDEAAIEARFGDGAVLEAGVVGILPAAVFDGDALAELQAPTARNTRLRVRGWAGPVQGAPPVIDAGRCVVVERTYHAR